PSLRTRTRAGIPSPPFVLSALELPTRSRSAQAAGSSFALSRSVLKISDIHEFAWHRDRSIGLPQAVTKCTVPGSPPPRGEGGHPCQLDHLHIASLFDHQG